MSPARELSDVLTEVVSQFGRRVVDRPAQLRAALSDTYGASSGEHQDEVTAAVTASAVGVATAIRDSDPSVPADRAQIQAWFDDLVSAGLSLRSAALATSSWAAAFNAPATARATSELSEELLAGAADAGTLPVGSIARTDPVESGPVAEDDAVTLLGADSESDLTEHVPAARSADPVPVTAPVATGAPAVRSWPPPEGPPVLHLDVARRRPGAGVALLRDWWPTAAAVVALGVTAAVCVPLIVGNAAPDPEPASARVIESEPPELFAKGDVLQFLLTDDELREAVPGGTLEGLWSPTPDFAAGYTSPDGTPWTLPEDAGCEGVLRYVPPPREGTSGAAVTTGIYDAERTFEHVARAYESPEGAQGALLELASSPTCTDLQVSMQGGTFDAAREIRAGEDDELFDQLDFGSFTITRHCVREINVVTCLYGSRLSTSTASDEIGGRPIWALVPERAAAAEPFDPTGGGR